MDFAGFMCYNIDKVIEKGMIPMNKIIKRTISSVLGAALAVSMSVGVLAESFTDMPDDWRTSALENAVENGLISGMGDGTIAPDANITRAQMAAIIVRALGATNSADISMFTDISADKWYYGELAKAVYMNAFSGDGSNMNPEKNITFQECFTVLSRVFGLYYRTTEEEAAAALAAYSDGGEVAAWASRYYGSVVKNGYWTGGEKKLLTPTEYITRGEFAVVMDNLVKTYITEAGAVEDLPAGNVVVRCSDAVLDGKKIEGDLIIGDGVGANKIGLNDIEVTGRLVFRGCATPGTIEVKNQDGSTGTKTSYTDIGCAPTGSVFDIQIIAPYIYINLGGLKYEKGYTEKDTCVFVGNVQQ